MWQMIWYALLMHALCLTCCSLVGVAVDIYKNTGFIPSSPFTQKPQKDGPASQAITGNIELQQGMFSDVESPEYTDYTHYILFQSRRVVFGKRFG